jgi:hypothetical protein
LRQCALLDGEAGNDLRLVVVENLEVFFFESTYCVALLVADQDWHEHYVYVAPEGVGAVMGEGPVAPAKLQPRSRAQLLRGSCYFQAYLLSKVYSY